MTLARTPLKRRTPMERGKPIERTGGLQAKHWGTRKQPKAAGWRDDFMPAWMAEHDEAAASSKKKTPYERALAAFVRTLPCCRCGRLARKDDLNEASHVTLSADQKGHGMKVPHVQIVSHCGGPSGCHPQWEERRGFCSGWSKERRYGQAAKWLRALEVAITPADRDAADELERWNLGKVIGNGTATGWAWLPGGLVEVGPESLAAAVPA